jgi:alkylhydroperoxidase family enzyme
MLPTDDHAGIRVLDITDLPQDLADVLAPRVRRLGYLGAFFGCTAHQPRALAAFMEFTEALKDAVPDRLTEVVALTVATSTGNDYERNQHERLCLTLGFDSVWVDRVERLDPDGLDDPERLVQGLALSLLADGGRAASGQVAAVAEQLGESLAVALLLLVARYAAHAMVVNALGLAAPVPSIFEEEER